MEAGADRGVLHMRKTRRPPGGRTLNLRAHGPATPRLCRLPYIYQYGVSCNVYWEQSYGTQQFNGPK